MDLSQCLPGYRTQKNSNKKIFAGLSDLTSCWIKVNFLNFVQGIYRLGEQESRLSSRLLDSGIKYCVENWLLGQ
jgi:hypothetical protein